MFKAPQVAPTQEIQKVYDELFNEAYERLEQFCRLKGTKPSAAMKMTDEELAAMSIPRSALPFLVECKEIDPPGDNQTKGALEEALETFKFPSSKGSPDIPKDILDDIMTGISSTWNGKSLSKEIKTELLDLADDDYHQSSLMLGIGEYFYQTLKPEALQHWIGKMGALHWKPNPTSRGEILAQVTHHTIEKMVNPEENLYTNNFHCHAGMIFDNISKGELQTASRKCGLKDDSGEGKVGLVVRLFKCFYQDVLLNA